MSPICLGCFVCLCMDSSCTDSFGMRKLEVEYHHQLPMSVLLVKTAAANCIAMAASQLHPSPGPKERKKEKKKRRKKNLTMICYFLCPSWGEKSWNQLAVGRPHFPTPQAIDCPAFCTTCICDATLHSSQNKASLESPFSSRPLLCMHAYAIRLILTPKACCKLKLLLLCH